MNDLLNPNSNGRSDDLEAGYGGAGPPAVGDLQPFFDEVAEIKRQMAVIRRTLRKLEDANEESKQVTRAADMKVLKEKMEADLDDVSKNAHSIKRRLEALETANDKSRQRVGCEEGSTTDRTRTGITNGLKLKLKDLMIDFQGLRQRFTDEYREVVERRIYTVTGQRPDATQVDQIIEGGESEAIFQKAIQEQGRGHILDAIAEIQERRDAVRDVERKLLELHRIFLDMAVLVTSQGEDLDVIANHVEKSVEHVQRGAIHLERARSSQQSARRWMCCGVVILVVAIVVVVVIVVKVVKP